MSPATYLHSGRMVLRSSTCPASLEPLPRGPSGRIARRLVARELAVAQPHPPAHAQPLPILGSLHQPRSTGLRWMYRTSRRNSYSSRTLPSKPPPFCQYRGHPSASRIRERIGGESPGSAAPTSPSESRRHGSSLQVGDNPPERSGDGRTHDRRRVRRRVGGEGVRRSWHGGWAGWMMGVGAWGGSDPGRTGLCPGKGRTLGSGEAPPRGREEERGLKASALRGARKRASGGCRRGCG